MSMLQLLKAGLVELKREQEEVIDKFVSGKDVFVSLPNSYGKSICFALFLFIFDSLRCHDRSTCNLSSKSIVICISPLTALMMNQREYFNSWGIKNTHGCIYNICISNSAMQTFPPPLFVVQRHAADL